MSRKIGYARESTLDQNLERQTEASKNEGCDKIYQEKITGKATYHSKTYKQSYDKCNLLPRNHILRDKLNVYP